MSEALQAYRHVAASDEFIQMEKRRSKTLHDEAQALKNAERRGEKRGAEREHEKLQGVIADKDTRIAEFEAKLGMRT